MIFFRKKTPFLHPLRQRGSLLYQKRGEGGIISIEEFEKISGATFISALDFENGRIFGKVQKKIAHLQTKGLLERSQIWYGSYFQKEIESLWIPDVSIRWIDDQIGWGVFAERTFHKMDFIAQYAGMVRKSRRSDRHNGYCFEYLYAPGIPSAFTIDAQDQSGIARFINHSQKANLEATLATIGHINHVVLYAKQTIAKDTQLTYDYGSVYWSKREVPRSV